MFAGKYGGDTNKEPPVNPASCARTIFVHMSITRHTCEKGESPPEKPCGQTYQAIHKGVPMIKKTKISVW